MATAVGDLKVADSSHLEGVEGSDIPVKVLVEEAAVGSQVEHELTALEAIKAYPMAIFWCLIVSMCVIMVSSPDVKYNDVMTMLTPPRRAMILSSSATSSPTLNLLRSTENTSHRPRTTSCEHRGRLPWAMPPALAHFSESWQTAT